MDIISQQVTNLLGGNSGAVNSAGAFIPGDLANRQSQTSTWIAQAGLQPGDVNQQTIANLLDVPSGWQANITAYIAKVVSLKAQGIATANTVYSVTPNAGLTGTTGQSGNTLIPLATTTAAPGLSTTTIILIAAAGYFLLKGKK
jgi:hypothetical protein